MNNKKPLIVAMEEAEQALVSTVNGILNAGVPCYFLELIVDKIHRQIKDGADRELLQSRRQYAVSLEAEQTKADELEKAEQEKAEQEKALQEEV